MTKKELQKLALKQLISEFEDIVYWEPDYEECGPQFGPGIEKAIPILNKILKLDPNFEIPEDERLMELLKKSKNKKVKKIAENHFLPKYWTMKNGNDILISDMDDKHLRNTIALIERKVSAYNAERYEECGLAGGMINLEKEPIYKALKNELEKRNEDT